MECKSLRDSGKKIGVYNVAYFMASVDTLEDNTRFAKEHGAEYPILSDPSKVASKAFGVLHPRGFTNRCM